MATTQQIWKYELAFDSEGKAALDIPKGGKILTTQIQNGVICLWVQVLPGLPLEERRFSIFGTGIALPETSPGNYIGTVQAPPYVWHIFEAV